MLYSVTLGVLENWCKLFRALAKARRFQLKENTSVTCGLPAGSKGNLFLALLTAAHVI